MIPEEYGLHLNNDHPAVRGDSDAPKIQDDVSCFTEDQFSVSLDMEYCISDDELLQIQSHAGTMGDEDSLCGSVFAVGTEALQPSPAKTVPVSKGEEWTAISDKASDISATFLGIYPTEKDVLFGRGGMANNNPGNKWYLQQKSLLQPEYKKASRTEKTVISQKLVDMVHERGGLFLEKDDILGIWLEVPDKRARQKASHSLREEK